MEGIVLRLGEKTINQAHAFTTASSSCFFESLFILCVVGGLLDETRRHIVKGIFSRDAHRQTLLLLCLYLRYHYN